MNVQTLGEEIVRSPDPGKNKTLEVIKSQKNLNSATYFTMQEEEPRQEAQKRSTRVEKTEMRQTWKRPRVPHHKKLDGFIQYNSKPAARSLAKDMVQKINMMEENNQYKYAQQFLSPLKPVLRIQKQEEKKRKEPDDNRLKQERKESMNPFLPVKNHIKMAKEIKDRLDRDMQDMSIERVRALKTHMSLPSFKLEEFVTVEIVKRSQNTGAVKKMLHVPTMRLYVIKEEPISTKESRNSIVEWIGQWQTKICDTGAENCDVNPFIKVYSNFWYFPEGSVSILSEYCEGGSLQDLLNSVDTLPENVSKEICAPLLKTLSLFYSASECAFGGLSTSQIMFTETGQFKLNMGLFYRGGPLLSSNIFNTRGSIQKPNLFEANNAKMWAKWTNSDRSSNNVEVERAIDVFKIGIILFQCAVGSFEIYEQSSVLFDNLKFLLGETGQKAVERESGVCCILHSEDFILNFINGQYRDRVDTTKIFKYMTFLKNRFSSQFISFLCCCLKLSHKKRAKLPELMVHPFVQMPSEPRTVRVTLVELLKISRGWCEESPSIELLDKKIEKLCESISIVLANCRKDYLYELKHLDKERIARLAKELGVRDEVLYRRFDGLLRDLQQRALH